MILQTKQYWYDYEKINNLQIVTKICYTKIKIEYAALVAQTV